MKEIWRDQQEIYEVSYDGLTFTVGKVVGGKLKVVAITERDDDYAIKGYATINIYVQHIDRSEESKWRSIPSTKCVVTFDQKLQ